MNLKENILYVLNNDVKPAVGCTEPVAIALGCAAAKSVIKGKVDKVVISISPNIYKNGMNVGIPGIDEIGLDVAAALGTAKGDHTNGLQILGDISQEVQDEAKNLLKEKKVEVKIENTSKGVYIKAVIYSNNDISKAIIEDKHDNITLISLNEETIFSDKDNVSINTKFTLDSDYFDTSIKDIINEIEKLDFSEISHMLDGLDMNKKAAELGMSKKLGIGVGYAMKKSMENGTLTKDLPNMAMMMTAAASDARMSGLVVPVMSSNGSGNHGLTAILPIAAYENLYNTDKEKLAKALAISHAITGYIKHFVGRLSPLCGCSIAAATGSSCAIVWLMGGSYIHMQGAIKNMLANQAGVICDGAKPGCALKLGTAAASGVQSAIFSINGFSACKNNGIVTGSAEEAIKNLGILSKKGMSNVDKTIIEIMEAAN